MSIPKNHHYVSQCHIENFFDKGKKQIYCYDKELNNFYQKDSSKRLFSEDFANTRLNNDQFDHLTLEKELNDVFEKDFLKHVSNIAQLANDPSSNNDSKLESLYYITCHGLIADVRVPANKKQADDIVDRMFLEVSEKIDMLGDPESAASIRRSIQDEKKPKYSNLIDYTQIAVSRLQKMGDLDFMVIRINSSDLFILPDTGCFQIRERINKYFNPNIKEVAMIGIPLTDKLAVLASSKKLGSDGSRVLSINDTDSGIVQEFNTDLYNSAKKAIATSDAGQLKKIVGGILNHGSN